MAAAVILPPHVTVPGVRDSKRMSAGQRRTALEAIQEAAVAVAVGVCSPAEVDRLNVLWASLEAMRRAVSALDVTPDRLLIDGDRVFDDPPCPAEAVVKGDQHVHVIAAASVVAKVTRDRMMHRLHEDFPAYGWDTNVGYPTRAHYAALAAHGPTPHHRRSFRLVPR